MTVKHLAYKVVPKGVETQCGKTVQGKEKVTAYPKEVTCRKCVRIANNRNRKK